MTANLAKARVKEALKNIDYTPLGKAFTHWITQDLQHSMEDILDFQITLDKRVFMAVTFWTGETHSTTMQHAQVLAFGTDQDQEPWGEPDQPTE